MEIGTKIRRGFFIILSVCLLFGLSGIKGYAAEGGIREFLNDRNRPKGDYSGDNREVFTIIEVIPHDACSTFPYLIDWKTEEEYNLNVPIGYDGVVYATGNSGIGNMMEGEGSKPTNKPYTQIKKAIIKEYLPNYNIHISDRNDAQTNADWWREDDLKTVIGNSINLEDYIKCKSGYFEYTMENKGLYYINTEIVKGEENAANGICYEMQALPRNDGENGKGEYKVKDAQYYWAKDCDAASAAYPTRDNIQSKTKFNYELSFREHTGAVQDAYKVFNARLGTGDYFVKLKPDTEKQYEFESYEGGNYNKKEGGGFQHTIIGKGSYIVKRDLITPNNWNEVIFEYAGTEKNGIYDVSFIYTEERLEDKILYEAKVKSVHNGSGRYALTSTSLDSSAKERFTPVYIESNNGDYGKVITKIDFAGIDFMETGEGGNFTKTSSNGAGARVGRDPYLKHELGNWVFREMDYISEKEYTKLADVKGNNNFKEGDKIYVNQQNRIYRYYCRNGFQNNEWFKLLCYINHPEDENSSYGSKIINGIGFDNRLTSSENLIKAKDLLTTFDNTYRIEVLQRTPGALTKEEVEEAELIYIADYAGMESFTQNWIDISEYLKKTGNQELSWLAKNTGSDKLRFEDDLSNDVLLALYDRCIYKRECALMVHIDLRKHYMSDREEGDVHYATKNLGKLIFFMDLMEDALHFAYFIEGYDESSSDLGRNLNLIHRNYGRKVLGIETWQQEVVDDPWGARKVVYNAGREGDSETTETWWVKHFELHHSSPLYEVISWRDQYTSGDGSRGKVLTGETKYLTDWHNPNNFNSTHMGNIWQILHNRKSAGKIIVEITNAELTYGEDKVRVIYADEFDKETFLIKYKITLKGGSAGNKPALLKTLIFFDDNNNGIHDAGELSYDNEQQNYDTEDDFHQRNVRTGFEDPSNTEFLNPDMTKRKVVVQATNDKGATASADVWVVVREGFNLN